MFRKLLKSKIHRAVVTGSDLNYVGSITIDKNLLEKAGIREFEFVHVVNINNGARFETYTVAGLADSGVIELNGAAARQAQPGDRIIIMTYVHLEEPLPEKWHPTIVLVDEMNKIEEILC